MRAVWLVALLLAPGAFAQNSPGDECIITVRLHDDLTTVSIAYDLLFDDDAWEALVERIDSDGDGIAQADEIQAFEADSRHQMPGEALPENRLVNLEAEFQKGSYSGVAAATPFAASNVTQLIGFEGPVDERAGKVVRETWTYDFKDPLSDYDATLNSRASAIFIAWGPDAVEEPHDDVSVIETVQVYPAKGWWVVADAKRHDAYTYQSGDGYTITFVPDRIPPNDNIPAPGAWVALVALVALGLRRRW